MVPRGDDGPEFNQIEFNAPPMYLWISDGPATQFLAEDEYTDKAYPEDHDDLATFISENGFNRQSLEPNHAHL